MNYGSMAIRMKHLARSALGIGMVFAVVWLASMQPVSAGPITGTPGSPPYPKLTVYQGIVAITPGASTSLKLGKNGNTIQSNGAIVLNPTNGTVSVTPQNNQAEGAELVFTPPSSATVYSTWHLDNYVAGLPTTPVSKARIFSDGVERLNVTEAGDLEVRGQLCLNSSGCHARFDELGGTGNQNLDQVLAGGNMANTWMWIGSQNYTPYYAQPYYQSSWFMVGQVLAEVDVAYGTSLGEDWSRLNGISAKANHPMGLAPSGTPYGSALYGEDNVGWAGYIKGVTGIFGPGSGSPTFSADSLVRMAGSVPTGTGYVLDVYNANVRGQAATFSGSVKLTGTGAVGAEPEAELVVHNSRPERRGTTIRVAAAYESSSVVGYAQNTSSGSPTYGLYGIMGTATGGATSYAAWLHGNAQITNQGGVLGQVNVRPYGGSTPWGIQFGASGRIKLATETWVCPVNSDDCSGYGKYIRTTCGPTGAECTAANYTDRANMKYCYDHTGANVCQLVYSGGVQAFELR